MAELLLIHSDTTDGSTTFEDSSGNNVTLTPVGNVQHSTAQAVLGQSSSIYFDGAGDYITGTQAVTIGSGNFTVDAWVWIDSTCTDFILANVGADSAGSYGISLGARRSDFSNCARLYDWVAATGFNSSSAIPTNQWAHLAFVRNGTTVTIYINGVASGSATYSTSYTSTPISIGGHVGFYTAKGYLSELRITNTAEWTHNFVPPTRSYGAPLTDYYTAIIEDNPVNYWRLGESSGNAIDEMGEHDLVWTGTPVYGTTGALVGDSNTAMTLDGSTEYASKSVANYRSGDSQGSIELWFNISTAHTGALVSVSVTTSTESRLLLYARNSTGQRVAILLWPSTTGNIYQTSSAGWDDGIWHHLACVSDGAGWSMYIDGVAQPLESVSGTNTGDWLGDITGSTNSLTIGAQRIPSDINTFFNGSLDEVAVYNYPLTAAQVKAHYQAGLGKFYAAAVLKHEPVNYWRLGETSGNALDEMGEHDLTWN